jgi:hypothetical protein
MHLGGLRELAQKYSKIYQHLKMSFLEDTFELDHAVALTFTKTQHNCSVQTDEKHNQELVKV